MSRPLRAVTFAILSLLFLFPASGHADAFAPEELVLDNGMQVLLFPHPGSGLVASNVFVGAGSTREEARYAGSSHFLEHLLFNGTTRRTQEEIYAATDRIGAYNNATTRQEYTHYMMVFPVERMAEALDIQADMLFHSILPPEKFEKERGIILEELSKDRSDPDYAMEQTLDDLLYGAGSAYARPVLGTAETISALPREMVVEYYKRQYVPSNMRLVLMGDFERDDALALIGKRFSADPIDGPQGKDLAPSSEAPLPGPPCTLAAAGEVTTQTSGGAKPVVELSLMVPGTAPDDAAGLALLAQIAGGTKSSRLEQALQAEPPLPHEETSATLSYREGGYQWVLRARLSEGASPGDAIPRLIATLRSLDHIDEAEFAAARTTLLGQEVSQLEKLHYYAIFEGDRLWHMPEGFTSRYVSAIENASAADTGELAQRLLANAPVQIVAAGPGVEPQTAALSGFEPSADLVSALVPAATAGVAEPTRSRPGPLEASEPPEVIRLDNGLTVIHTASPNTRMFALHLLVENRSLREPEGEAGIADLLHRTMADVAETSGDAPTSPLERIGATLKVTDSPWIPYDDYYTTPLYSFVRLECVDEYYREALDLLTAMLTAPHDDATNIADAHKDMMAAIQRAAARPADVSRARLRELLYPDHPLSMPVMGDAGTLDSITPAKLAAFASGYLAPGGMILSVVGDVPRNEAMEAVRATLGRLPEQAVGAEVTTVPPVPLTTESNRSEIDGRGKQSSIRMGRVVDIESGDRWPLLVAVQIASERMQQDLRETRGLAYSLGIGVDFEGGRASITASMGTRAENLEEAEAGVRSYLTGGGLDATADEVEKAVNGYLSRMRMRRITSMGRAFNLGVDLFLEGGVDYAAREAAGLASVTPDDVDRVAKRYLVDAPMATVIVR